MNKTVNGMHLEQLRQFTCNDQPEKPRLNQKIKFSMSNHSQHENTSRHMVLKMTLNFYNVMTYLPWLHRQAVGSGCWRLPRVWTGTPCSWPALCGGSHTSATTYKVGQSVTLILQLYLFIISYITIWTLADTYFWNWSSVSLKQ